jgi:hypothetical protein
MSVSIVGPERDDDDRRTRQGKGASPASKDSSRAVWLPQARLPAPRRPGAGRHALRIQRDDPLVDPANRVWPLRTILGSNVPLRSRGTARSTAPISVSTVLALVPFRLSPTLPGRMVLLITQVPGHLLASARSTTALVTCDSRPSEPSSSSPQPAAYLAAHRPAAHRPAAGRPADHRRAYRAAWQCLASRVLPRAAIPAAHRQATSLTQPVRHGPASTGNRPTVLGC